MFDRPVRPARPVLPSTTTSEIARHVLWQRDLAEGEAPDEFLQAVIGMVTGMGREGFLAEVMPYVDAAELARATADTSRHGIHLLQAIAGQPIGVAGQPTT